MNEAKLGALQIKTFVFGSIGTFGVWRCCRRSGGQVKGIVCCMKRLVSIASDEGEGIECGSHGMDERTVNDPCAVPLTQNHSVLCTCEGRAYLKIDS